MPRSLPPSYKRPEPIPQPYFLLDIIPASVLFKPASGSSRASNESFVLCDTSDPVSQPTRLYASHTASINKALQTKPPIAKPRDSCFNPTGQKANLLEPLSTRIPFLPLELADLQNHSRVGFSIPLISSASCATIHKATNLVVVRGTISGPPYNVSQPRTEPCLSLPIYCCLLPLRISTQFQQSPRH